jgi:hypothetical protein
VEEQRTVCPLDKLPLVLYNESRLEDCIVLFACDFTPVDYETYFRELLDGLFLSEPGGRLAILARGRTAEGRQVRGDPPRFVCAAAGSIRVSSPLLEAKSVMGRRGITSKSRPPAGCRGRGGTRSAL